MKRFLITIFIYCISLGTNLSFAQSGKSILPATITAQLQSGIPVELIVEYDAALVDREAKTLRMFAGGLDRDDELITNYRANRFTTIKRDVDAALARPDIDPIADYSHLPMAFKRFRSLAALQALLAHAGVVAVYENKLLHHALATSLPLINQPAVAAVGDKGAGTTVAVIDDGINYTLAAFGFCTAPGTPSGCRVVASVNFGTGTTDNSHGTNVSAIVLGVAPLTQIAMLNAFSGTTASSSNVISAINWSISNRSAYNIVAINMSLGDSSKNIAPCTSGNPFYTPITNARNSGISVVAAAGNDTYTNALAKPACTPNVISVGAVYDANWGGLNWGSGLCTDATTAPDQVTCFSDSASFLTMLAPGAIITAAGITEGGTSQASPHVAGAIAVLRAAYPNETLSQTAARLTSSGVMVTDARNGISKPRLNLQAAAQPANNIFANRSALSGNSGAVSATTLLATKESGEPNHANNIGGYSIWWKWSAPASGQVSLDTHGSGFDTVLAVYTGTTVSTLTKLSANDNDGSANSGSGFLFQAQSGAEYQIAIDGANGASGSTALNWALNTSAQANLSASISGPTNAQAGADSIFTATVANAGPQAATNITLTLELPSDAVFVSGPSNCSVNGSNIVCIYDALNSGATASVSITVNWNGGGTLSIAASAGSDVPDSSVANNSAVAQVEVLQGSDNDIPLLPNWALLTLGLLLAYTMTRKNTALTVI